MAKKIDPPELPLLRFAAQHNWLQWLEHNHEQSSGVWLQLAKKGSDQQTLSYAEALETALCYGWIDSQKKGYDADFWLQKFTPRTARSPWSQINREKAKRLLETGQMQPAGLTAIEAAQQDGRWEAAYAAQSKATVPEDLQAALEQNPKAQAFFASLDSRNRYAILYRLQTAKKAETRARRLQKFLDMLQRQEKIYP